MKQKERYCGLDILRVICMCGIVGLHCLYRGGVLEAASKGNPTWFGVWILEICFYCVTNTFAILSGFLCAKKRIVDWYRLLSLLITVLFWCCIMVAVFYFLYPEDLKTANALIFLFPSLNGRYWYITCYVLMFCMIPYINIVVRSLGKKQYQRFLLILFILLSIIPTVGKTDFFRVGNGYSPWWLIYNYLIGAYFNRYGFWKLRKKTLVGIFGINVILAMLSVYFEWEMGLQYISPFIVGNAVCLFGILYNIKVENEWINKNILLASEMAFDVYIIHCNILIYDFILKGRLEFIGGHNVILAVAEIIIIILVIYIVCQILGIIRNKIFQFAGINHIMREVANKMNVFLNFEEEQIND